VLLLSATTAEAQSRPRLDVNLNVGTFGVRPDRADPRNYDDWYSEGRYAASIGYYWTENLETEFEFATSGEGRQYIQEFVRVSAVPNAYSVSIEKFHRLQQTSLRMVWQFFDNTWVHPYVNGGVVLDINRSRQYAPPQYYYPGNPVTTPPVLVRPDVTPGTEYDYRASFAFGGGAKFFVSPNSYINTGAQLSLGDQFKTITLLAGFGMEF
jgi:hypothetical protein